MQNIRGLAILLFFDGLGLEFKFVACGSLKQGRRKRCRGVSRGGVYARKSYRFQHREYPVRIEESRFARGVSLTRPPRGKAITALSSRARAHPVFKPHSKHEKRIRHIRKL